MKFNLTNAILTVGGTGVVAMLVAMGGFATGANNDAAFRTFMVGLVATSTAGAASAVARL